MGSEPEPTLWEIMRVVKEIRDSQESMRKDMVPLAVFSVWQQSVERQIRDVETDQTNWAARSQGEHEALRALIDNANVSWRALLDQYRERQEELERKAAAQAIASLQAEKKDRATRALSISLAVLAIVGSLFVDIIQTAIGAP